MTVIQRIEVAWSALEVERRTEVCAVRRMFEHAGNIVAMGMAEIERLEKALDEAAEVLRGEGFDLCDTCNTWQTEWSNTDGPMYCMECWENAPYECPECSWRSHTQCECGEHEGVMLQPRDKGGA